MYRQTEYTSVRAPPSVRASAFSGAALANGSRSANMAFRFRLGRIRRPSPGSALWRDGHAL
jgi:hypothetical protein